MLRLMSWERKTYLLLCVAAICLLLVSSHSYSDYNALVEADFLGHGLKFEAGDFENVVVDKPKVLDLLPHSVFLEHFSDSDVFRQSADPYFPLIYSDHNITPLRC